MRNTITLHDVMIEVVHKNIKNLHLGVYPPHGRVRISAPRHLKLETIRIFAISKLAWIKRQRKQLLAQERQSPREYLERESHYVWGQRYLLKIIEFNGAPKIELKHRHLQLFVRPDANEVTKQKVIESWYRDQLKKVVKPLIEKWEALLDVEVERIFVQKMKTKWGACNSKLGNIRFNTELAKKSPEFLEYIVAHEMIHLLESTHNKKFIKLMDEYLPKWRFLRNELNRSPLVNEIPNSFSHSHEL